MKEDNILNKVTGISKQMTSVLIEFFSEIIADWSTNLSNFRFWRQTNPVCLSVQSTESFTWCDQAKRLNVFLSHNLRPALPTLQTITGIIRSTFFKFLNPSEAFWKALINGRLTYPEGHSTKTFKEDQWKFNNVFTFLRLIAFWRCKPKVSTINFGIR